MMIPPPTPVPKVNPEIFVIGGGVSKAGEVLFDYIKPPFEKTVFQGCKDTVFALATLGNDAGIYVLYLVQIGNEF